MLNFDKKLKEKRGIVGERRTINALLFSKSTNSTARIELVFEHSRDLARFSEKLARFHTVQPKFFSLVLANIWTKPVSSMDSADFRTHTGIFWHDSGFNMVQHVYLPTKILILKGEGRYKTGVLGPIVSTIIYLNSVQDSGLVR